MGPPVFWASSVGAEVLRLSGAEGHHAAVVRRLAVGERVAVSDGRGAIVQGRVRAVDKRGVDVSVESRARVPVPAPRVTVVQAMPKGSRAELAVEALTEVGVDRIVPWASARSQVRVSGEHGERLVARWGAWAHEASKQSRRAWFCEVASTASTAEVAALLADSSCGLVLHEGAAEPLSVPGGVADVVLVVGPEGGLTDAELLALLPSTTPSGAVSTSAASPGDDLAPAYGVRAVRAVRLGDTVLRTSTAGAVAAGVVLAATRWR